MKKTLLSDPSFTHVQCNRHLASTEDALYVIGGKWTLRIMIAVLGGHTRFNELQRTINGISARVLSAELKDLELNGLLERVVLANEKPVVVEYRATAYSTSLEPLIANLADWGMKHKKKITAKSV